MPKKTETQLFRNEALGACYTKILHPSGVTVYVFPKQLSTTYALFATRYGSLERVFRLRGEESFTTVPDGVAHYLEHKMFEQEDGSDVFGKFAALGANANAYTSNQMTCYLFSTTSHVKEALEILLEYVTHPYFTKENVQKEQGIIGQEIGMYDDNPNACLYYALLEGLYRNHNVKINIAGTVKTIADITPEILYRCYRTFYDPSNMVLAVCGNVTEKDVMEVVDKMLPARSDAPEIECRYPEEDAQIAKEYTELHMSVSKPLFAFGVKDLATFTDPMEKEKHGICMNIVNRLLFSASSAFYTELYDKGLISSDFSAEYEWMKSCAYNIISGESADPEAVYAALREMLERVKENPPSREDFERVRKTIYADNIRNYDSTDDIASALVYSDYYGLELFASGDIVKNITYEEILELIRHFYDDKQFARAVILPSGK